MEQENLVKGKIVRDKEMTIRHIGTEQEIGDEERGEFYHPPERTGEGEGDIVVKTRRVSEKKERDR